MREIVIVGGGLAGLTLGIGLRQRGVPVTVHEAGRYPRHRVCGEFVSGRGIESLRRLGLLELIEQSGARWASGAAFFSGSHEGRPRQLPSAALCVSRFLLDALLAEQFRRLGGKLHCGGRWTGDWSGEGVVRASGRRVAGGQDDWRWLGLKAHARNVKLSADLEMHFSAGGYVGLCRLPGDVVNVCGLFRRSASERRLPAFLPEVFSHRGAPLLGQRLRSAEWDDGSICSVAGLSYRHSVVENPDECSVGDAMTVIPPVTGNGMSIAFESAEAAVASLADYAEGQRCWERAREAIHSEDRRSFARRIKRASWMHWMIFQPAMRNALLPTMGNWDWLWRVFFRLTR
jgi:2-polyprenyl-6-methoxyphenol hydroxylase-like FAD-dependent oxidoreductase